MEPKLKDIETFARQAGEILRQGYGTLHQVEYKSVIDPVTEVDHRSEAFLLEAIQERFPQHRIITEESDPVRGDPCCAWIVDPLDGTVNFAHGVPIFCVSVAYMEEGQIRLGAVYDPMRAELFSAECGRGAWLNGEKLSVGRASSLNESLLVTGFPYDIRTLERNNLEYYAYFALRSQGVRRLGSAALDLCYTAAARFDGYWELYLQLWDMAAGTLIAKEAGARVTTVSGEEDIFQPPYSILAANPVVHAEMLTAF